jgi:hypothetical protein
MKYITLLLVFLIAFAFPNRASADIAPPQQPPGFNLEPGTETTQVRMLAETVIFDVPVADPPIAHVSADFTMHNQGNAAEDMVVSFPLTFAEVNCTLPEIENVRIKVNGRSAVFERTLSPVTLCGSENDHYASAEFDVSFPPGEDVNITVSYDLDGTSYEYETYTDFYYILQTGAGWKDTIGSGEIILRLPYDASPQNVILDDPMNQASGEGLGAPEFYGREARWMFTELEPTAYDDLTIDIVKPAIWNQVVIGLQNTTQDSRDGDAWGFLGKAYKQALFASGKGYPRVDAASTDLYQWSREAYEKAVTLKPEEGLWHAGYAELLLDEYYWVSYSDRSYTAELDLGLRELALAVRLAPNTSLVKKLIEEYLYMFPDYIVQQADGSLEFVSLTATPQPSPTTITPTVGASRTPRLASSTPPPATTQAEPMSQTTTPLCGGAALLLIPVVLFVRKTMYKI